MTTAKAGRIARITNRPPFFERDGVLHFHPPATDGTAVSSDALGKIKVRLKRLGPLYSRLVSWFSPILPSRAYRRALSDFLDRNGPDRVVLNLGSGPGFAPDRDDVINVDLFAHPGVDMTADISALPLHPDSVDGLICVAVLEHLPRPLEAVDEMWRVLKPGGDVFCFMPFMQPFHAAPDDYTRLTRPGLLSWFSRFETVECGVASGSASAFLWLAQHFMALLLSCGSQRLYALILAALMVLTFPFKHLDRLLERLPQAETGAAGFYLLARKPSDEAP